MGKKDAEYYARRTLRLREVRTAAAVAKALKVDRCNRILFPAVAAALGQPWSLGSSSRVKGYAFVMEYAERHGIKSGVRMKEKKAVRPLRSAKATAPEFLQSYAWRRLRMVVLAKRGARCECCGASPKDGKTVINIDHIKPRKLFPELALEESNLQVLCDVCNHGKGNWDQTDWRDPEPEGPVH